MPVPLDDAGALKNRIAEWLAKEGYPLEFSVANTLSGAGFRCRQGEYVRDEDHENVREIDVTAVVTRRTGPSMIRVYQLLECKWSKDKPWVVFVSEGGGMAPSALITQSIGSRAGRTLLWARAGDASLHRLRVFETPNEPGFGGRQALADKKDVFYNTIQAVVTKASLLANGYDEGRPSVEDALEAAIVVFPTVIVGGLLYKAAFDSETASVSLQEATHVRLHWRGAAAWRWHATVDVVAASAVPEFAKQRFADASILAERLAISMSELHRCWKERSLDPLEVTPGARGVIGMPPLLRDMTKHFESTRSGPRRRLTSRLSRRRPVRKSR